MPGHLAQAYSRDDVTDEKKKRTITFGEFHEDTKGIDIVALLNKKVEKVSENVDETFAYGKKWATRGAVRFKSETTMWEYLKAEGSPASFQHNGKTIYTNRDVRGSTEDEARTKAVRKLVRTIIERVGTDGSATKALIDANYHKGIVRYKDVRVGEYIDGKMQLKGEAENLQAHFDSLMQ